MPIAIKDIKGCLIDKTGFPHEDAQTAIDKQSEVNIDLNREKLARLFWKMRYSDIEHSDIAWENENTEVKITLLLMSDAIRKDFGDIVEVVN